MVRYAKNRKANATIIGYNNSIMAVKVIHKKGNVDIKDIIGLSKALKRANVTIGVHKKEGQTLNPETQTPVIKYACWNEFGTHHITKHKYKFVRHNKYVVIPEGSDISIPPRPFVRVKNSEELRRALKLWHKRMSHNFWRHVTHSTVNGAVNEMYGEVGRLYLHQMWHILQSSKSPEGDFERNKPLTEFLKGFDHPLIDTGTLFKSLRYKVNKQ